MILQLMRDPTTEGIRSIVPRLRVSTKQVVSIAYHNPGGGSILRQICNQERSMPVETLITNARASWATASPPTWRCANTIRMARTPNAGVARRRRVH
jgi:hypothetical protein